MLLVDSSAFHIGVVMVLGQPTVQVHRSRLAVLREWDIQIKGFPVPSIAVMDDKGHTICVISLDLQVVHRSIHHFACSDTGYLYFFQLWLRWNKENIVLFKLAGFYKVRPTVIVSFFFFDKHRMLISHADG